VPPTVRDAVLARAARLSPEARGALDAAAVVHPRDPRHGLPLPLPTIAGFDVTRPHTLVYQRHGRSWQLGALEWVFTEKPASPPLPGATYGSFGAACHYKDGTFVPAAAEDQCARRSPQTGARFNFWHPDLVTLHVWLWYHNPDGLYSGTNPLVRPFNKG
jgi:hypothetical protein